MGPIDNSTNFRSVSTRDYVLEPYLHARLDGMICYDIHSFKKAQCLVLIFADGGNLI